MRLCVLELCYSSLTSTFHGVGTGLTNNLSVPGRTLVAAAVKGIGVVRFADYYIRNEISRGELETMLEKFEVQDAAIWIVYADRHDMPTRVRLLIGFLDEQSKKVLEK